MPLHHHGRTPRTKAQQRKRSDSDYTLEQAAGHAEHDVNAEPFDNGRWERAVDDHIAGYRPAATTGGTMSQLSELADSVGSHVDMREALAAVAQAAQVLQDKKSAVMALLADTAHAGAVEGAFGAAEQQLTGCLGPINVVGEAIGAAAGAIRGGS